MTRFHLRRLAVATVIAGMFAAGGAHAACFTVDVPSGSINVPYNPLDGAPTVKTFQIEVHNNGCGDALANFGLANTPVDANGTTSGSRTVLNFDAQIDNGGSTVNLSSDSDQVETDSSAQLNDGETGAATGTFSLAAHSVVPYAQRDFTIYVVGVIGGVYVYSAVAVHLDVASITQLSFAGAATSLTMDFGELTSNASQNIAVLAQATVPFHITWSSQNDSVLKNLGSPSWTIPYTATLNGAAVSNTAPYVDTTNGGTQGASVSLPLIVTIGDADHKRAGTYQDIVTITIHPD